MLKILEKFDFYPPELKEWSKNNLVIKKEKNTFVLSYNKKQWMCWDTQTNAQVFELFAHYYLAEGHCLCTGLGFTLRESWILKKPNVTKITVLEKNKDIIEYHKNINNPILSKINIVNENADNYIGDCDTLLIDHISDENEHDYDVIKLTKNLQNNIKCNKMWVWSIEPIIIDISLKNNLSLYDSYYFFKKFYNLHKFPDLSNEELTLFFVMFYMNENFIFKLKNNNNIQYK